MTRSWTYVALGATVSLVVSGFGLSAASAGGEAPAAGQGTTSQARVDHRLRGARVSVDYRFAVNMAEHHEDAVEMARLAVSRSSREPVRDLASEIARTQAAEILLLRAAAERLRVNGGGGGMHGGMGGGMHRQDDLSDLTSDAFDRAFLSAMIQHHRMGVHMAQMELERGSDPEVRGLAAGMVEVQTEEIRLMQSWLEDWFGAPATRRYEGRPADAVPVPRAAAPVAVPRGHAAPVAAGHHDGAGHGRGHH